MSDLFAAFGVNWKLLLIQAVNFGLLLAALSYFLYKPILKIIDERRHKIAEGVRTAEAAAERLEEAEKEGDTMVKEAQARADQMMAEARARAEEEKRKAMMESEREITRAAMLAAEKIMKEKAA